MKELQEMYPKTVNLSLIVLAIFPTTFSANCDNIIRLEELQNIIKNQTSQNELQTQVIKDQQRANSDLGKGVEDQRRLIQNQTEMLHDLREKMDHMKTGVHFTVGLSQDTTFMDREIIKFDKIITNTGDGYIDDVNNDDYGKFIVPQNGTYHFSANFYHRNRIMGGDLRKNLQLIIVGNNGGRGTGSLAANLDLKKGEEVYIQKPNWVENDTDYDHDGTSFSGFLIHPET